MADIKQARRALVARILEGEGKASLDQRRAAFNNACHADPLSTLIDKVARYAHKITDEDIAAARTSGLSEDQISRSWSAPRSARPLVSTTRRSRP
jgi:hypothetical protein